MVGILYAVKIAYYLAMLARQLYTNYQATVRAFLRDRRWTRDGGDGSPQRRRERRGYAEFVMVGWSELSPTVHRPSSTA